MRTRDDFAPHHPLPVFLSGEADPYEELRGSPWLLKAGLFAVVVATIVIGAALTSELSARTAATETRLMTEANSLLIL